MKRLVPTGLVFASAFASLALLGCGGSDGIGTDPGTGTMTLLVDAHASYDNEVNTAEFRVNVRKGGANLDTAQIKITSEIGEVFLISSGGGDYRGVQSGWSDEGYILLVEVKDAQGKVSDELEASLAAPVRVVLVNPDPAVAIDAKTLPNNILKVEWKGPAADSVSIKTKDFDPPDFTPDPLHVDIPAAALTETTQKLEIERKTGVNLAGGLPGSRFTAEFKLKTGLIILNPN